MENKKVLEGVRVLDAGRFLACPYCGWILSQFGAEVIRLEKPGGEFDRYFGLTTEIGENISFLSCVSGKKSVTLDMSKGPRSAELLGKLIKNVDVVIENLGPGAAEEIGLTYQALSKIRPDIILVNISAFGKEGPLSNRTGFDGMVQAMAGHLSITGTEETQIKSQVPYIDYATATNSALSVLAALLYRYQTGKGQNIDVAMLNCAVALSGYITSEFLTTGKQRIPRRIGSQTYWGGYNDICLTKDDKYVYFGFIGFLSRRFFRVMGKDELINDPRFDTDSKIFENRHILDPIIKEWVRSKTYDEIETLCVNNRLTVGQVVDYTEVADIPQVKFQKIFVNAGTSDGSFKMPVSTYPTRFSEDISKRGDMILPRLGEHNNEIWGTLCGLTANEIDSLKAEGII